MRRRTAIGALQNLAALSDRPQTQYRSAVHFIHGLFRIELKGWIRRKWSNSTMADCDRTVLEAISAVSDQVAE